MNDRAVCAKEPYGPEDSKPYSPMHYNRVVAQAFQSGMTPLAGYEQVEEGRRYTDELSSMPAMDLLEQLSKRRTDTPSLELLNDIMCLMTKAGWNKLPMLIRLNQSNFVLAGEYRRFFKDTVNFILTGEREMSVETWKLYLDQDSGSHGNVWMDHDERRGKRIPKEESFDCLLKCVENHSKDTSYVSMWLNRPDGLNDLLHSMQILMGRPEAKVHWY